MSFFSNYWPESVSMSFKISTFQPSLSVCGCCCWSSLTTSKGGDSAPQGMSPIFNPNGPRPTEAESPWWVLPGMWSRELNQFLSTVYVLWWEVGVLLGAQPARDRVCIAVPLPAWPAMKCLQLQRQQGYPGWGELWGQTLPSIILLLNQCLSCCSLERAVGWLVWMQDIPLSLLPANWLDFKLGYKNLSSWDGRLEGEV